MKIVFIGKGHEFSLVPLAAIKLHHNIVGIVESGPRKDYNGIQRLKAFLHQARSFIKGSESLLSEARKMRVPYMLLTKSTRSDLVSFLRAVQPDIICVASLNQLLSKDVLAIPRYGAINLHPSKLPKYHGPFPWFWQYYNFELEIGVTVHALDEGQDTGPILKQAPVRLPLGTDIMDAIKLVAPIGAKLMVEGLGEIEQGRAMFMPQPIHQYPKARIIKRDEKLIEWDSWPIERVWHFMRGTYPWLDAVEYPRMLKGHCRIGEFERSTCNDKPGQLYKDAVGFYVAHREGKIRIHAK